MSSKSIIRKHVPRGDGFLRDTRKGYEKAVYGWDPLLAELPHMVPCSAPGEAKAVQTAPDTAPVPSRIPEIVAAIAGLSEPDFVTSGAKAGWPKVDALTGILGWGENPVTAAEREEAWAVYQKEKAEAV